MGHYPNYIDVDILDVYKDTQTRTIKDFLI
jgi:hypothetical protein